MFDLGMPPHGGFAIGLERLTGRILNLPNVRQAVLLSTRPLQADPVTADFTEV
jgi:aspartyl/asparaginyl-tRNA synthetase